MEDVFDLTGRPPHGWMHALFGGGPYGNDVGRCIPGPPAPETLAAPLPGGGEYIYRLCSVGHWAPDDPIAVYNDTGPTPEPPLTEQEEALIRRGSDEQLRERIRRFREEEAQGNEGHPRGSEILRQGFKDEFRRRGLSD